ncbi:MAG: TRAP transporter large permease [Deltaproteobacteria bacterium]|nr:MAG: TRAP transporter large permease [Deltaproteobacteria bacterium]
MAADGGGGGGVWIALLLVALVILGAPLFLLIGLLATAAFVLFGEGLDQAMDVFPSVIANLTKANVLLAIPFFVVSGAIMSAGDIANRLIAFTRAVVAPIPGGLAVATVGACVFFAAISGSSPVTVIAIGSIMYPALCSERYREPFALGLVTTAGSLGILIPPSIPMILYALAASGARPLDVGELFLAGVLPGLLIGGLLAAYGAFVAMRQGLGRERFDVRLVLARLRDGFWALMLPVVILGGIYSGLFTPTEAAAVSVAYAVFVELFIHRELTVGDLPRILADSAVMMGTLLVIMALAFALNHFLVDEQVPDRAVAWIRSMDLSAVGFLLVVNVFLLFVGALMDSVSAILILAPLLTPIAAGLGIDPVHMGVVFIVNLEIGYLTPPIGLNLFVASAVFEKKMGEVIRSVVPFIGIMLVGLLAVTYVPSIALGPVRVLLRDEPFYVDLPSADDLPAEVAKAGEDCDEDEMGPLAAPKPEGGVLSVEEMMEIAEDLEETGGDTDGPAKPFAGGKVLSVEEMMQVAEALEDTDSGDEGDEPADEP